LESASLLAMLREQAHGLQVGWTVILGNMDEVFKVYLHNPPHYFVPNAMYMVTGAILNNQHLLTLVSPK